jgi:hypothetical protein
VVGYSQIVKAKFDDVQGSKMIPNGREGSKADLAVQIFDVSSSPEKQTSIRPLFEGQGDRERKFPAVKTIFPVMPSDIPCSLA